jgi:histone H3/H4
MSLISEKYIKNTSINRLSKRAGVKTLSNNTYPIIHAILSNKIIEITNIVKSVNNEHGTKNIMPRDLQKALEIAGVNLTMKKE